MKEFLDFFCPKKRNQYNVLDLFCGCGGFSLGFKEGFEIIHGVDFDNDSIETYKNNITRNALKIWIFQTKTG